VSYSLEWSEQAINNAAGFLSDDSAGLAHLVAALDSLKGDPRPAASTALTSAGLRRLRVGRYRSLYRIHEDTATIAVVHIGRTG
jgi:mRNA interferase RelE/StbE